MKFKKTLITLSLTSIVAGGGVLLSLNNNSINKGNDIKENNSTINDSNYFISKVTKDRSRNDTYSGDGFTYEIINNEAKLISTTYPTQNNILEIPDVITYNNIQYPVTLYADNIFDNNSNFPSTIDTIIISENTKEFSENFLGKNPYIKHVTYKSTIDSKEKIVLPKNCINVRSDIKVTYEGNDYVIYDDKENGGCKLNLWKQNTEVAIIPDYITYNEKKIWVKIIEATAFSPSSLYTNIRKVKLPNNLQEIYQFAFYGLAKYGVVEQITYRDLNSNQDDGFVLPDSVGFCQEFTYSYFSTFEKIRGDVIISKNINSSSNYLKHFPNARSITYNKNLGYPPGKGLPWTPAGYVDNGDGTYTIFKYASNVPIEDIIEVSIIGQNTSYNLWDNLSLDVLINNNPNFQISPGSKFSWLRKVNNNWEEFSTSKNISNILLTPEWINSEIKVKVTQNNNVIESSPIKLVINQRDFTSISFDQNTFNVNECSNLSIEPKLIYYDNNNHDNETSFTWERYLNNQWQETSSEKTFNLNNIDLSWNNNKLRLKASYKGQEIISNELSIIVKENPKLVNVEIQGLKINYVVGDNLSLTSNVLISDNQDHSNEITYKWEKKDSNSDSWQTISTSSSFSQNSLDINWNNTIIRLTATFDGNSLTSKEVTINVSEQDVVVPEYEIINVDVVGIKDSYELSEDIIASATIT